MTRARIDAAGEHRTHALRHHVEKVLAALGHPEGFVTDEKGAERRVGPGDVVFFPAGTNTTWRHPDHFKKIAVLKESVARPLGVGLKLWNKLLRMLGFTETSPFRSSAKRSQRSG